jgi:5'-nucleotidase / UDP-sugar diphosphatase
MLSAYRSSLLTRLVFYLATAAMLVPANAVGAGEDVSPSLGMAQETGSRISDLRVAQASGLHADSAPVAILGEAAARIDGDAESCGRDDCALGILVAEAMRSHLLMANSDTVPDLTARAEAWPAETGIVAALVPSESFGSALAAGPVTPETLNAALPGGERLVEIEATGAALLAALEHGAAEFGTGSPRLLQVAGLRYSVDPDQPSGQRVAEVRLWRPAGIEFIRHGREWVVMHSSGRWTRIDPAARYRLATTDSLARGEGGYASLAGAEAAAIEHLALAAVLADYLRSHSPYAPVLDDRIALR